MRVNVDNTPTVRSQGGAYLQNLLDGNVFIYHIASQAMVVAGNGVPTVFNPLGSGKLFIPVRVRVCFTSGTTVIGSVLIAETLNAGSSQATAGAILTFTKVEPKNALRGSGKVSSMFWSPTTNTFTAAPTVVAATGINVGPVDPVSGYTADCALDGTLAFAPGTAMSLTYSVATSTALFHQTIWGVEVPLS
jgi:hypothetical protein